MMLLDTVCKYNVFLCCSCLAPEGSLRGNVGFSFFVVFFFLLDTFRSLH